MKLRTPHCLGLLALGGCLLTGYDERPLPREAPRADGTNEDGGSTHDAGAAWPAPDASAEPDLDAHVDTMRDAARSPDSAELGSVEGYCRTYPCGTIKECADPASCVLGCGPLDVAYEEGDAGRRDVHCTFDCSGSDACETSCGPSLHCQTACLDVGVCSTHCGVGARCDVHCGGRRCKAECESGSRCTFDCRDGRCDAIVCRAGASCLLRCNVSETSMQNDAQRCGFSACEAGEPQRCGNGSTVVCGRPCPPR